MSANHIESSTLEFLQDLKGHNDRTWFKANRARYDLARADVAQWADTLLEGLTKTDQISTPSGKKSMYRIHRDVRFSKDKTPYNLWMSGYFRRASAHRRGGYYYKIMPDGGSIIGGGFWGPNKEDLLLIRQQIQMDDEPLREVLKSKRFKSLFETLQGSQLKTSPKGFDKEDPNIDLLRYKQFLLMRQFTDKEVKQPSFANEVVKTYEGMRPFLDVMTMYLTTDLNGEPLV